MLAFALVALLAFGGVPNQQEDPNSSIKLIVTPRNSPASAYGRRLTAMLLIKNMSDELWCADVEWEWKHATAFELIEREQGNCVNEAAATPAPEQRDRYSVSRSMMFSGAGEVWVTVRFYDRGRMIKKKSAVARIH